MCLIWSGSTYAWKSFFSPRRLYSVGPIPRVKSLRALRARNVQDMRTSSGMGQPTVVGGEEVPGVGVYSHSPSQVLKLRIAQVFELCALRLQRLRSRELPSRSMQSSWKPRTENQAPPTSVLMTRSRRYGDRSKPFSYAVRLIWSSLKGLDVCVSIQCSETRVLELRTV